MAYATRADVILEFDERDMVELLDDERILDDLKSSKAYQFQVDTSATSGHFENSSSVAVTVGAGNTARHLRADCKFRIESGWLEITSVTGDGETADEVAVSSAYGGAAVPAAGVYIVETMEPEAAEARLARLIEKAEAEVDVILTAQGVGTPVTMDSSSTANIVRSATVSFIIRGLVSRRKAFNPERDSYWLKRADAAEEQLKTLQATSYELARFGNVDTYLDGTDNMEYYQQTLSRERMSGY